MGGETLALDILAVCIRFWPDILPLIQTVWPLIQTVWPLIQTVWPLTQTVWPLIQTFGPVIQTVWHWSKLSDIDWKDFFKKAADNKHTIITSMQRVKPWKRGWCAKGGISKNHNPTLRSYRVTPYKVPTKNGIGERYYSWLLHVLLKIEKKTMISSPG